MSEQQLEADGSREISEEVIAKRAYEISQTEEAGTSEENWARAEHELREAGAVPQ